MKHANNSLSSSDEMPTPMARLTTPSLKARCLPRTTAQSTRGTLSSSAYQMASARVLRGAATGGNSGLCGTGLTNRHTEAVRPRVA